MHTGASESVSLKWRCACAVESRGDQCFSLTHSIGVTGRAQAWIRQYGCAFKHEKLIKCLSAYKHLPKHSSPVPVNPVLQVQVKSPFCTLSLAQSALMSQGPDRHGSGSVVIVTQVQVRSIDHVSVLHSGTGAYMCK